MKELSCPDLPLLLVRPLSRICGLALVSFLSISLFPAPTRAQWQTNGNVISDTPGMQIFSAIVADGAGGYIVAWQSGSIGTEDIYAQRINATGGVLWAVDGVAICTAANTQSVPRLVSDSAGGAIIAWSDNRTGSNDIYAQRINGAGVVQWPANGVALCTATNGQIGASIVPDGAGGAIVAWTDFRGGASDVYACLINSAGTPQWAANGVALCTASNAQSVNAIVSDGAGGAIVVWQDSRSGTSVDVYARRIDAAGVPQWTANGNAICTATGNQFLAHAVSDGAGGAVLAWQDRRGGTYYDIYAARISGSGVPLWTADGVAVCTAFNSQHGVSMVADGAGGAIVAWEDDRFSWDQRDIYVQRLDASGVPQWLANGVVACNAVEAQYDPSITSDDAGGAIVAWRDERIGGVQGSDIYGQRIDSTGAVQWAANGIVACAATGHQVAPMIVADGGGGAVVAWGDGRLSESDYDIYALRIGSTGAIPTGVRDTSSPPPFALGHSYPNPVTATAAMDLTLHRESTVSVDVFDVAGRCVRAINLGHLGAGLTRLAFDGRDEEARALPSGVYFYRVSVAGEFITRKIVIRH